MFKRFRMATALMLVSALSLAMLLAGCEGDDAVTSANQPLNEVTGPKGTVTGTVLDTNGNPLTDVTVGLAGKTTTTNETGQYVFENVAVTYTMGADQHEHPNPLVVKVNAPEGYLGATVTVDLFAQFDGSNDYTGAGDVVSEGDNKTVTLVDGFAAQAGTAVLPALTGTVTGWLRNCDGGDEAIANATIALDLRGVALTGWAIPEVDGTRQSYQSQVYMATTGSDGKFTITGVPIDSELAFATPDYNVTYGATTVDTYLEDAVNVGEICATLITSGDNKAPYIVSASPIVGQAICFDCDPTNLDDATATDYRAILKKGTDGTSGIQITFNEPMATGITSDSVILRNVTTGAYITDFTASISGKTLTITLTTPLAEGEELDVILDRNDFTDTSGNMLVESTVVGYDYAFGVGSGDCGTTTECIPFIKVCLAAYTTPNTVLGDITGTQVCDMGNTNVADLDAAYPGVFTDCCSNEPMYQQLNGGHDPADVATQLSMLGTALAGSAVTVETDWAAVRFTPADGVDTYLVGLPTGATLEAACTSASNLCDNGTDVVFVANTSADATFGVSGVEVGDAVTITPVDDFGYTGSAFTVRLNDCAKPTVVLQTAYDTCNTTEGAAALVAYGSGAELSDEGVGGEFASLIYPVTPRMLGRQESQPWNGVSAPNGIDPAAGLVEPIALWDIYTLNGTCVITAPDSDECNDATQNVGNVQDAFIPTGGNAYTQNIYDATAFAAYAPARRLGLAVSEDLLELDATEISYDGSVTLDTFNFLNDVARQDTFDADGAVNTPPADIVLFNASNILDFANVDHGSVIDLTGAMTDLDGNVSDDATTTDVARPSGAANAKIAVYDRMPPFVSRAFYGDADGDGQNELTVDFNEDIVIPADAVLTLVDPNGVAPDCVTPLTQAGITTLLTGVAVSADAQTLTVDSTALCAGFSVGTFFPTAVPGQAYAVYDEVAYDDVVATGTDLPHGILNTDTIEDVLGNSWSDWNDGDACTPTGLVQTPEFAVVDVSVIQNLEVGVATQAGVGAISAAAVNGAQTQTQTFTWSANQPVDWALMFGVSYNTTTGVIATPATWFGYGTPGTTGLVTEVEGVATATAAQVVDAQTLRVTFNITAPVAAGDAFGLIQDTLDPTAAGFPANVATEAWVWSSAWSSADPATELEQVREFWPYLGVQP